MGREINFAPDKPLTEGEIPSAIARDTEFQTADAAHLAASDPHPQYLLPAEADARYRLASTAITDAELPSTIARDSEVTAAMSAHLAAADPHPQYLLPTEADARYFRGISATFTVDPPSIAAGSLHKVFFTVNGANVGDFCAASFVGINLFEKAAWPFVIAAVVEASNTIGFYLRNDHSAAIDLAAFQVRILVVNF